MTHCTPGSDLTKLCDPLPISPEGDAEQAPIFLAVGQALSSWEGAELAFATSLSMLLPDAAVFRMYGSLIGSARFELLDAASSTRFGADNPRHDRMRKLLDYAKKMSGRRAEIAHGRVIRLAQREPQLQGYYLTPSLFGKKTDPKTMAPKYAYTSKDLLELGLRFDVFGGAFASEVEHLLR